MKATKSQRPMRRLNVKDEPSFFFFVFFFRVGCIEIVKFGIFRTNNVATHNRKRTLYKGRCRKLCFVGDANEEIAFLSSSSLPNVGVAL